MSGYTFKVYLAGGREYFEYGTRRQAQTTRKDAPFPESLLALLELDSQALKPPLQKADRALRNLYDSHDPQYADTLRGALNELAKEHIYFQLLRLDWNERLRQAEAQNYMDLSGLLPRKQLSRLPGNLEVIQNQLRTLFARVLNVACKETPATELLAEYDRSHKDTPDKFTFQPLTTHFEPVNGIGFAEVLYPKHMDDLVQFFLRSCIRREQRVRLCKNCGRYFALTGRANAEYCERTRDEKGRTCRDVGAIRQWTQKRAEDEVFRLYRREYKRRFAWIKAGKITPEDFYAWSRQARARKAECDKGALSQAEYQSWLSQS